MCVCVCVCVCRALTAALVREGVGQGQEAEGPQAVGHRHHDHVLPAHMGSISLHTTAPSPTPPCAPVCQNGAVLQLVGREPAAQSAPEQIDHDGEGAHAAGRLENVQLKTVFTRCHINSVMQE